MEHEYQEDMQPYYMLFVFLNFGEPMHVLIKRAYWLDHFWELQEDYRDNDLEFEADLFTNGKEDIRKLFDLVDYYLRTYDVRITDHSGKENSNVT